MASLFKRKRKDGSHVWYVTGYVNGKHFMQSTGTSDKKLALEVQRKIEEDNVRIEQGLKPAEKITPIMLSEFIPAYLEHRKKALRSPKTQEADGHALRLLLDYAGDRTLTSINESPVREFRQHLASSRRPASVNLVLRHLKSAFSWAVDGSPTRYLHRNPFKQKDVFLQQGTDNLPRCLSPDERRRFFEAIERDDLKRYFQFLTLTGCRRNEALSLEWSDIDWERRQIIFRKTKGKSDRIVPIGLELMQILLKLDLSQPRPFCLKPEYVTHAFKKYAAQAELRASAHLHCLRHTAASDLVRQGVHLSKVQKLLGHTSVQITERYAHVLPEDLREAAELLTCCG